MSWFSEMKSIVIFLQGYRPLSWMWLKMWCIAWWHSGREDDDDDDHGCDKTVTPLSAETPLTGTVSRSASLSGMHSTAVTVDRSISIADNHECMKPGKVSELSTKSISNDSVRLYSSKFQNCRTLTDFACFIIINLKRTNQCTRSYAATFIFWITF